MKRLLACCLCIILLSGCAAQSGVDRAIELRQQLLAAENCQFTAQIVADYGDSLYTFTLDCSFDAQGNMTFAVIEPQSISGITGTIAGEKGFLTFDEQAVAFPLLADGQLTPVSAPWIFWKSLRSGYIHSSAKENDLTYLCIDDSFEEDSLQVDIWLNTESLPVRAEILHKNRRILSLTITDFVYV